MLISRLRTTYNRIAFFSGRNLTIPAYLGVNIIPSLDGLRAISILWVILGHLRLSVNMPASGYRFLDAVFSGGQMGVKLFFVISGFLITTLLIKEKSKTTTISLKNFYIRRFLRIFPVFYLYLLVVFILNHYLHMGVGINGPGFICAALYISNFFITSIHWSLVHSWSLSVEEQYYFLWPSIFKKNASLAIVVAVCFIILAPMLRIIVYYYPAFTNVSLSPFINWADSIFIGSLLAIILCKGMINIAFFTRHKRSVTYAGFLLMWMISYSMQHGRFGKILLPFGPTFTAIIFCCIIISNIIPANDFLFRLLNSKVFKLVGRLSYSIYIWQQLFLLAPDHFPSTSFVWNTIPVNLCLVSVISVASYYGFEKYFLILKKKFKV